MVRPSKTHPVQSQVILSAAATETESARSSALRSKFAKHYAMMNRKDRTEITDEDQKKFVFTQMQEYKTWKFGPPETEDIWWFIFEKGLDGVGDEEKLQEVYDKMEIHSNEIGKMEKLKVWTRVSKELHVNSDDEKIKINNQLRIRRDIYNIIESCGVDLSVKMIREFADMCAKKENGQTALYNAGVILAESSDLS